MEAEAQEPQLLIPKLFHQVWVGPHPFPENYAGFREKFREHYPDFDYRLYTDDTLPPLKYPHLYEAATTWSVKSDLIRYQQVLERGGFYWDIDFESIRRAASVWMGLEFVGCNNLDSNSTLAPGFFGATPGHPVLVAADELLSQMTEEQIHVGRPDIITGPVFFRRAYDLAVSRSKSWIPLSRILPPEHFYPLRFKGGWRKKKEDAYAVHWWAGSWFHIKGNRPKSYDKPSS